MEIVKLKTNRGRVLYAIRSKKPGWFTNARFVSLYTPDTTWENERLVIEFCASESLSYIEGVFKRLKEGPERITKTIIRKCKCGK